MWIWLAANKHSLHNPCTFFPELGAESTVDDDVDGGVDDEEKVAHAGQVVGPFRKGLHASAGEKKKNCLNNSTLGNIESQLAV